MTTLNDLFRWMDNEVGVIESPPHSNHVRLRNGKDLWVDYYGYQPPTPNASWCGLFQSVSEIENGTPLATIESSSFHGFVGVDNGRRWFADNGLLVPDPQPGYLAFFHEHVGRVRSVALDGSFLSLEGNEGDGIRLVTRHRNEIVGGFGVRTYQQEDDVTPQDKQDIIAGVVGEIEKNFPAMLRSDGAKAAINDALKPLGDNQNVHVARAVNVLCDVAGYNPPFALVGDDGKPHPLPPNYVTPTHK